MTKISAIMALFNTPFDLLQKTVESILNQTLSDFELIVIDDSSTTDYTDFFKKFNDSRIKYIKLNKNSGPGHARNVGIKSANGDYIAIVDSDDIYLKNRFEIQSKFLDKKTDIDLISCALKQSNNGKISNVTEDDEQIKTELLFNSPIVNPAVMFRRKIFIEKNLFYTENKTYGEDYELWIDALFEKIKMANLKDILMIYTRRKGQLSSAKIENQIQILKNLYKKIFLKLNISPTEDE